MDLHELKIDLPVKLEIQTCQKLIARKVLCFSYSKVSKLDSINSRTVSINSQTASNVSKLDSSLDPRSFRESRIENRVSSIELRGTVNLPLSGTVPSFMFTRWGKQYMEREHSKEVLKARFYFNYFYYSRQVVVAPILKVIRNLFQTFHSDGLIGFRY